MYILAAFSHLWYRFKYGQWSLSFVINITIQFEFISRAGWNFKISFLNASMSVKPEGAPWAYVRHLTFHKNFCQNPHCGAPKFGQIRSNIPTFQRLIF